jgi:hypothetical protein
MVATLHSHLFQQQALEFKFAVFDSQAVGSIDYPNESVGLLKVVSPICTNGLLASNIPYVQFVAMAVSIRIPMGCI